MHREQFKCMISFLPQDEVTFLPVVNNTPDSMIRGLVGLGNCRNWGPGWSYPMCVCEVQFSPLDAWPTTEQNEMGWLVLYRVVSNGLFWQTRVVHLESFFSSSYNSEAALDMERMAVKMFVGQWTTVWVHYRTNLEFLLLLKMKY